MSIHLNSRLRVNLTFQDVDEAGNATPINLAGVTESVRIVKPDGTELTPAPTLTPVVPANGTAYWEAAENVLDLAGTWKVQGIADGYRSAPVEFRVTGNP